MDVLPGFASNVISGVSMSSSSSIIPLRFYNSWLLIQYTHTCGLHSPENAAEAEAKFLVLHWGDIVGSGIVVVPARHDPMPESTTWSVSLSQGLRI